MKTGSFDNEAFYMALDAQRQALDMTWRQVAGESGVNASTLTRMAQGRRPDVDGLAALCAWSGLKADDFVRAGDHKRGKPETLALISTQLRADRHLSPASADALDAIIRAAYKRMRAEPKR
jgi:transcriptional regulator with XRE-family HTH domain